MARKYSVSIVLLVVLIGSTIGSPAKKKRARSDISKDERIKALEAKIKQLEKRTGTSKQEDLTEVRLDNFERSLQKTFQENYAKAVRSGHMFYSKAEFSPMTSARLSNVFNRDRFYQGRDAAKGEFRHTVSFQEDSVLHLCSGFIYNIDHVVTAAHCCRESAPDTNLTIHAGTLEVSPDALRETDEHRQVRKVVKVIRHNDFDSYNFDNDICMIRVDEPFIFNDYVGAAELPLSNEEYPGGTLVTSVGWGKIDEEEKLQYVDLATYTDEECAKKHHYHLAITPNMICAGSNQINKQACTGDSGGPLVLANNPEVIVGIASWAEECGMDDTPLGFTQISHYLQWMRGAALGLEDPDALFNTWTDNDDGTLNVQKKEFFQEHLRSSLEAATKEIEALARSSAPIDMEDNWEALKELSQSYTPQTAGIPIRVNDPKLVLAPVDYGMRTPPFDFPYPVKYVTPRKFMPKVVRVMDYFQPGPVPPYF